MQLKQHNAKFDCIDKSLAYLAKPEGITKQSFIPTAPTAAWSCRLYVHAAPDFAPAANVRKAGCGRSIWVACWMSALGRV